MVAGPWHSRVSIPLQLHVQRLNHCESIDAQWIVARKDFNKSVRRRVRTELSERERRQISESSMDADEAEDNVKMDELGCILYFHGGGYYFGSVDQERCVHYHVFFHPID